MLEGFLARAQEDSTQWLGLAPRKSTLRLYDAASWPFGTASGRYDPATLTANVNVEAPYPHLTLLHELYGHGVVTENTRIGRESRSEPINGATNAVLEGAAMLIEEGLAGRLGYDRDFEAKMTGQPADRAAVWEYFKAESRAHTTLHTLYKIGLPKNYSNAQALDILGAHFPLERVKIAVLYGSRGAQSDIDIYVVGETENGVYNDGVIDASFINPGEAEEKIRLLDLAHLEPVFRGTLLQGEKSYLEHLQRLARKTPITDKTIEYSQREADRLETINKGIATRFSKSYRRSAQEQAQGTKWIMR